ncbi:hypothetical protein VNO80_23327 [Phaseolus coccineus]|uniref:Uncharacterized protein n=1 Tax=Phaseolus coccineus TaxID=3886 RepID=A0AAN9M6P5_PHACN
MVFFQPEYSGVVMKDFSFLWAQESDGAEPTLLLFCFHILMIVSMPFAKLALGMFQYASSQLHTPMVRDLAVGRKG